jgi:hypothetical protein
VRWKLDVGQQTVAGHKKPSPRQDEDQAASAKRMSQERNHARAYLLADRIVGALLDSEAEGIVLSIDIGGSLFDVAAKNAARASRHRYVGFPTLVRYRSQQRGRSDQPRAADIASEQVLFGRVDGFAREDDEDAIFEIYGPQREEFPTRSIDSWTKGRPSLRLIHFGDPRLALDQLAGAAKTIVRDRPVVTFYTAGLDAESLSSVLHNFGYGILNLEGEEAGEGSVADFGWIAVPLERKTETEVLVSQRAAIDSEFTPWHEIAERNAPLRQQRSRSVFGIPANSPALLRKLAASDIIVDDDCYPVESDGLNSWRWLGPRPRTRLHLPCTLPGIYQVEIVVIASHLRSGLGGCRILVEGREIRAAIHGTDHGTIRFVGQLEARTYNGAMVVDIVSPGTALPAGGDPRALRLNVQSVEVSPWR